jgi:hypothetical protein
MAMLRLSSFPQKDPQDILELRRKAEAAPSNADLQIALALALASAGCTYEAAALLRPLRSHWKLSPSSQLANEAVDAQSWWNRNGREFARLKYSGNKAGALALLGNRAAHYWDLPPLLLHLGEIAAHDDQLDLASHLFHRVFYLSGRGLPKMNMAPFAYVAQAALVDVLHRQGDAAAALDRHLAIKPNPGNAMAHEIQHARLLVAAGHLDAAMQKAAAILVTARKHRTGYGKELRMEFINTAPDLAPLRARADWKKMLDDPDGYLRGTKKLQQNL